MIGKGILIVLDAVGIGGAPDAKNFDDQGADTLGNIRKACVKGEANLKRFGKLRIPQLAKLGIFASHALANNHYLENNNFSWQRTSDGFDTDSISDWELKRMTPKSSNGKLSLPIV